PSAWLYLGRTSIYFLFFALLLKTQVLSLTHRKQTLLIGFGLLITSCLIQYFLYPSLRNLLYAGYDPHMGRMVGPFLDPNLLGLALVWYLIVLLPGSLLYITPLLLFTYSRISILTGIISVGYWYIASTKQWMVTILAGVLILAVATLLPRSEGIGTDIWRVNSLLSKPEAFRETMAIAKRNPLFGVGFNTLPQQQGSSLPYPDNSRFGIDNTLFTVWATSGIVGIVGYLCTVVLLFKTYTSLQARALTIAFFIHSLSVNSFFTPTLFLLYTLLIFYIQSSLPASSRSRQRQSPQP
ncbi:MAG: O-antigen ligase family protein, partial [Candidatus Roizmanbacteria bacterium]|nr:O-antigen ligase family protein [Candidatus Roizmanbacteria bacterium]